jgi:uncharacterized membrane protein YhaH (DUF805 family)
MFKNPISFKGRIQRLEYAISLFICSNLFICVNLIDIPEPYGLPIALISTVVLLVVLVAQSTKRCHDIGKSGWNQLIPFYFIILLFRKSE